MEGWSTGAREAFLTSGQDDVPSPIDFHDARQVRALMHDGGSIRYCDHCADAAIGTRATVLYMTRGEQERTLADSGFDPVAVVLERGGLVLYHARAPGAAAPPQGDTP